MSKQQPLDPHQQELVNVVKAAHKTLGIARKTRTSELARRIAEAKLEAERALEREQVRIKLDLDREVEQHAANLDEALIAAYDGGVPIRRIALDGFGNRYDGGVQQLLVKLRADGRLGNREGYQRNNDDATPTVVFPQPVDVDGILAEATTVSEPTFTHNGALELAAGFEVPSVMLELDSRDPWFARIAKNARPGTPFLRETTVTLYEHPATGALTTHESRETGDMLWDHPVARWVKEHPDQALAGFKNAIETATETAE